jgi:hypothetical protein
MDTKTVLDGLLRFVEDDWLGLWVIANDVEELLGIDDPIENLELTVGLVKELLKSGLRAGDSPVQNPGVRFRPWPNQDPDAIANFIRRQWLERAALPAWGDGPWFAVDRTSQSQSNRH